MAFELLTELPTGVSGDYWRLGFVQVICNDYPTCVISMDLYLNKASRDSGKAILERRNINMALADIDASFSFDFRACIYNSLKQLPEWAVAEDLFDDPNKVPVTKPMTLTGVMETEKAFRFDAYDPFNSELTFSVVDQPSNGSVVVSGFSCTYTPDAGFAGVDTFTYQATNGEFTSDPTTITINIPSFYPVAIANTASTFMNDSVEITLNAVDPRDLSLTFAVNNPSHGTVELLGDVVTYTPDTDYVGADSFTFTASNGTYVSTASGISVTINSTAPTANNVSSSTFTNTAVDINADATDPQGLPLTYTVVTPAANGIVIENNGVFNYTPNTDFNGVDSFTYRVSNGSEQSTEATVTIAVG